MKNCLIQCLSYGNVGWAYLPNKNLRIKSHDLILNHDFYLLIFITWIILCEIIPLTPIPSPTRGEGNAQFVFLTKYGDMGLNFYFVSNITVDGKNTVLGM